jgi:medium-chain acyl-[acyl-carrier-protein] hydrolase
MNSNKAWFTIPRPNPRSQLRLFCFPYAGGAATIYRQWPQSLPAFVEVIAVQPPGRGARLKETPFTNLRPLVESAAVAILPELDRPFALFGHSMGAIIAFELAHLLLDRHGLKPSRLFVSGRRAPQIPTSDSETFKLPDAEFIEELRRLQGTPDEVLAEPELMQLILPLLRADFEVVQTYVYHPGPPLPCPLTVYGGAEDWEEPPDYLNPWRQHTSDEFSAKIFDGGHFFLHTHQAELLQALGRNLEMVVIRGARPPVFQ